MGTTTTTVTTCDKCGATIANPAAAFSQILVQKAKTVPYPARTIACSTACSAFILNANATALTAT